MSRIRLINPELSKVKVIDTDVTTWGELKETPEVSDMYRGDVKAVIRENEVSLEASGAQLPSGKLSDDDKDYDYTLFFVTKKSKAGDRYEDMSFSQLRSECSGRQNIQGDRGNYGSSVEMRRKLREDDATKVAPSTETSSCDVDRLASIESKIDEILDFISSLAPAPDSAKDLEEAPEEALINEDEEDDFNRIYSEV